MGALNAIADFFGLIFDFFRYPTYHMTTGLGNALQSIFNGIVDFMNSTFHGITNYVSLTPDEFGDGGADGTIGIHGLNGMINVIVENAVMPIATLIFAFFVMYEFVQIIGDKNSFKEFSTSFFVQWIIKSVVALAIILNTHIIVGGIFEIGGFIATQTHEVFGEALQQGAVDTDGNVIVEPFTGFGDTESYVWIRDGAWQVTDTEHSPGAGWILRTDSDGNEITERPFFVHYLLNHGMMNFAGIAILGLIMYLIIIAMTIIAYVVIINRLLEMILYSAVAPIPFATFMNSEFGQIGKNFIKGLCALALQGFFIVFIVVLYQMMMISQFQGLATAANTEPGQFMADLIICMVLSVVLIMMMLKTSALAKSVMNTS